MKLLKRIRSRRLVSVLLLVTIVFFVLGVLFIAILDKNNQNLINTSITSYFKGIHSDNLDYSKAITTSLMNNLLVNTFIWLLGISIIGIFLVIICLIVKSFILGFSFSSILYTYNIRGLLPSLIYIVPHVITLIITFIVVYYSISFSILLWNYFFRKKEYNRTFITRRYLKLLVFSTITLIIASLIEVFLVPFVLQLF